MRNMRKATGFIAAGIGAAALAGALAPAASAASCTTGSGSTVCTQVQVPTSITLTLNSNAVNFGSLGLGQTNTGTVTYTASANAPFSVNMTGADLSATGGTLPASAMNITDTVQKSGGTPSTGTPVTLTNGTPVTVDSETSWGTFAYSDKWSLTVPSTQTPGAFSGIQTYSAIAS